MCRSGVAGLARREGWGAHLGSSGTGPHPGGVRKLGHCEPGAQGTDNEQVPGQPGCCWQRRELLCSVEREGLE